MATDLGFFLQAFNPVDFIKGYEQSEKFATEQDLAKARARTQEAAANIATIGAEEFATPQFRETRRVQDEQSQFQAGLGSELARISRDVTREKAGVIGESLGTDIETQREAARDRLARQRFQTTEQTPFTLDTRRWQIEQDKRLQPQIEQEREDRFRNAVAATAETRYGNEGKQIVRDVEIGVADALKANPKLSEYDALETLKQGADGRKLAIIRAYQENAATKDLIKASAIPGSPQFEVALKRIDPNLRNLGPDPSGGMRIGYAQVDENGVETVTAAQIMELTPNGVNDFIVRLRGQIPQQRTAAARTTTAKPTEADARAAGGNRLGATAATGNQPPAAGPMGPPAPPKVERTSQDVATSFATQINEFGAGVPAGADIQTVGKAVEETRQKLDKLHSNLRKELFGKPRNLQSEEALALREEMTAVEEQMQRLRKMSNTIEDAIKKAAPKVKVRTVQELLAASGGGGQRASGKITQPIYGPGE